MDFNLGKDQYKPFVAPQEPVCLQSTSLYTYDVTKPPPLNNQVKLYLDLQKLDLSEPAQKHALRLVAGKHFDPVSNTISFTPQETSNPPHQDICSRSENTQHLLKIANEMINESNKSDVSESLKDVPLDLSHARISLKKNLEMPQEWLEQAANLKKSASPSESTVRSRPLVVPNQPFQNTA